jgi:hypothetical protein
VNILKETLPAHFEEYNMKMNVNKTTEGEFAPKVCTVPAILGCDLTQDKEVAIKRVKAMLAYKALSKIWRSTPISNRTKVRLCNATVLPHFTYSAGAMSLRQVEVGKLETIQRKQLRHMLGHKWDRTVSNYELHQLTGTMAVGVQITRARWTLLGHLARKANKDDGSPASQIMKAYYRRRVIQYEAPRCKNRRGRLLTTIPRLLQRDVADLSARLGEVRTRNLLGINELTTGTHMLLLRQRAENRSKWLEIVLAMQTTAQKLWLKREGVARAKRMEYRERAAKAAEENQRVEGPRRERERRGRGRPKGTGPKQQRTAQAVHARGKRQREIENMQQSLANFMITGSSSGSRTGN